MKNPKTQPVVATGQPPNTPHRAKPWPEYRTPATPVVGCAGSLGLPLTGLALDRHKQQRGRGGYGSSRGYAEAVYNQARRLQRTRPNRQDSNKNGVRHGGVQLSQREPTFSEGHPQKTRLARLPFLNGARARPQNQATKNDATTGFFTRGGPGNDPNTTRPDPTLTRPRP